MGLLFQFGNSSYEQKAITMRRKEGDYVTSFLKLSPPVLFSSTYFERCVSFWSFCDLFPRYGNGLGGVGGRGDGRYMNRAPGMNYWISEPGLPIPAPCQIVIFVKILLVVSWTKDW